MASWGALQANQTGRMIVAKQTPLYKLNNGSLTLANKNVTKNDSPIATFSSYDKNMEVKFSDNTKKPVSRFYKVKRGSEYFWIPEATGYATYEAVPSNVVTTPQTSTSNATTESTSLDEAVFEQNLYLRPVLQIKAPGNKLISMGLRLSSVQTTFSNQFMPNQTNAGWYIHSAGAQLSTFSINGFFLDTKTNQEFNDFMTQYQKYLKAYREGDFYSSAICTFFFKGKQYKCLVSSFSQSQNETELFLSRFNLQLLVLKERGFNSETLAAEPQTTVAILNEPGGYYDNLSAMVINPITAY